MGDMEAPNNPAVPTSHDGARPAGFVDCDESIERLYFYLDGELTEERRVAPAWVRTDSRPSCAR